MTTQLKRLSFITVLSAALVAGSFTFASAAPTRGRIARARASVSRGLSRAGRGIRRGFTNTKTWVKSDKGKKFMKGAALVGGGMLVGAALANPVGAGIVLTKAATLGVSALAATAKTAGAVLATKVTVGHALAAGAVVAKGVQYNRRAKENGTSRWSEFKKDAKSGFGLFNLFKRGNKAQPAPRGTLAQPEQVQGELFQQ